MNNAVFELALTPEELVALTGGYTRASEQLEELRRQGFFRARASRIDGKVILERAHYLAVCTDRVRTAPTAERAPQLRPIGP